MRERERERERERAGATSSRRLSTTAAAAARPRRALRPRASDEQHHDSDDFKQGSIFWPFPSGVVEKIDPMQSEKERKPMFSISEALKKPLVYIYLGEEICIQSE